MLLLFMLTEHYLLIYNHVFFLKQQTGTYILYEINMDIFLFEVLKLFFVNVFFPFLTFFTFMVNNFSVINEAHN